MKGAMFILMAVVVGLGGYALYVYLEDRKAAATAVKPTPQTPAQVKAAQINPVDSTYTEDPGQAAAIAEATAAPALPPLSPEQLALGTLASESPTTPAPIAG